MPLPVLSAAVEGVVDEAVVRRLISHAGGDTGTVYGRRGKPYLKQRIGGFNQAARHAPWVILVDLDNDAHCAAILRAEWLPNPAPQLCFRIALREVETWLLADREAAARFLSVAKNRVPQDPESVTKPKEFVVNLARRSRRRDIREDMVPRPGSGRAVGPAYTSRLAEFASTRWRPPFASERSDSLRRAIRCIQRLVESSG